MLIDTLCRNARRRATASARGFTMIEVLIVVAIIAILAAVAMPSYSAYLQRAKVPAGLDALQSYFTRMEQRFQDTGSYKKTTAGVDACAIDPPNSVTNYTVTCELVGTGYKATATGSGAIYGYQYTIDATGTRKTAAHPKGAPTANCWSIKGGSCDA